MKHSKDEPTLIETLRKGLEEAVDTIDLDEIHISAEVVRKIQRLNRSGDFEAAKDLYVSSVMNGVSAAEEKRQLDEWARSRGGVNRGVQKTKEAHQIREWLYPLLIACDEELPAEKKNRGWKTMQTAAKRKLSSENIDDPRKACPYSSLDQARPPQKVVNPSHYD